MGRERIGKDSNLSNWSDGSPSDKCGTSVFRSTRDSGVSVLLGPGVAVVVVAVVVIAFGANSLLV